MKPQAGVALTTGANDALGSRVVGASGPCVTVVAAPSMSVATFRLTPPQP